MTEFEKIASWGLIVAVGFSSGCGGDDETSGGGTAQDAGSDVSATGGSGGSNGSDGCELAGGQCQCAGGCPDGFEQAEGSLAFACPQPPPNSGACGQMCCLPVEGPDAAVDANGDGGTLVSSCNPDGGPVCPDTPPTDGDGCSREQSCCNYDTPAGTRGCICGSSEWICAASACGCAG